MKVIFNQDIKRFSDSLTFTQLTTKIQQAFLLPQDQDLKMFYLDCDGDIVSISS
jgi:hypothetical protein